MLILILIEAQHSRKAVFSFEKRFKLSKSLLRFPSPNNPPPPSKICDPPHWWEFPTPTPYHYLENPDVLGYVLHNRISSFHCERLLFMLYQKSFQSKKNLTCIFEFQGSHVVFHI